MFGKDVMTEQERQEFEAYCEADQRRREHAEAETLQRYAPRPVYHVWVPGLDLDDEKLAQLISGEAACYHRDDSPEGEKAAYHLTGFEVECFEAAQQTGILINPTHDFGYLQDAIHNVWKAYQHIHGKPAVEVCITPARYRSPYGLGWVWKTVYSVRWDLPMSLWLRPEGVDELRFLMSLATEDDPIAEWQPGKSHVDWTGHGALEHVPGQDALALAKQVLIVLERFKTDSLNAARNQT
jgi:hypothetical protein